MENKKCTLIKVIPIKRRVGQNIVYDSVLLYYRDEKRNQEN